MCRNLHKLIERSCRGLQVPITTTPAPIKTSRRGRPLKQRTIDYPLMRPSDWVAAIFKGGGHFFLGGCSLDQLGTFQDTLAKFWADYQKMEPDVVFEGSARFAIPFALHGDEGRGKGRKPIMILSMQPLITSLDMSTSNLSGCLNRIGKFGRELFDIVS